MAEASGMIEYKTIELSYFFKCMWPGCTETQEVIHGARSILAVPEKPIPPSGWAVLGWRKIEVYQERVLCPEHASEIAERLTELKC